MAEKRLDALRPRSAALFYGNVPVGVIHDIPGLEPLRGEHLRPMLSNPYYRAALGKAMLQAGGLPEVFAAPGDSAHSRRRMPNVSAPLVRDEQLPAHLAPAVDPQHRAAVPPVHHVA